VNRLRSVFLSFLLGFALPHEVLLLRHPLVPEAEPIAPDLLVSASEVGIDAADFGDDVAAFLEGGVSLARDSALLLALR